MHNSLYLMLNSRNIINQILTLGTALLLVEQTIVEYGIVNTRKWLLFVSDAHGPAGRLATVQKRAFTFFFDKTRQ